jgi:hypothetical protein
MVPALNRLSDFQKLHCVDDQRNELYEVPLSAARITEFAHKNLIITRRVVGKQLVKLHKVFAFVVDMQGLQLRQHAGH